MPHSGKRRYFHISQPFSVAMKSTEDPWFHGHDPWFQGHDPWFQGHDPWQTSADSSLAGPSKGQACTEPAQKVEVEIRSCKEPQDHRIAQCSGSWDKRAAIAVLGTLLGSWRDTRGSQYELTPCPHNQCHLNVKTTRPDGSVQYTNGLSVWNLACWTRTYAFPGARTGCLTRSH